MNRIVQAIKTASRIWLFSILIFSAGWFTVFLFIQNASLLWTSLFIPFIAAAGSLPILAVLSVAIFLLQKMNLPSNSRINYLIGVCFFCCLVYGAALTAGLKFSSWGQEFAGQPFIAGIYITGWLFACTLIPILFFWQALHSFFSSQPEPHHSIKQNQQMENTQNAGYGYPKKEKSKLSGNTTIKGLITGSLILVMMIPTLFISGLVKEREERQKQVAEEVSSKWASAQTLAGPYLYLPYSDPIAGSDKESVQNPAAIWALPEDLHVNGDIGHEIRPRSIYKVLLFHAGIDYSGHFSFQMPKDIEAASVHWNEARICFALSDFKGIEERILVHFNGYDYELSPGLPESVKDSKGLSASVPIHPADLGKDLSFSFKVKLKGSSYLHFIPLSGNSEFRLRSSWPNPSFDGSILPTERRVDDHGFTARWTFNNANLPFGTLLKNLNFDQNAFNFGVTMLEPADQYAKTNRSVKYAILIIGLSFSIFFIAELLQKKPMHPVQYILVGLALVIFYTLLLSMSEFILFDWAYGIAAGATVLLVSLYAKAHFGTWRSGAIFAALLGMLYGFIFVLIRLEDTALLVGSIGLFVILALAMYAGRNINWYGNGEYEPG